MDEKQNKRKNRSDDDRQNPFFLMVHKTVENNHFYCGLLLLMFMSIVNSVLNYWIHYYIVHTNCSRPVYIMALIRRNYYVTKKLEHCYINLR